MSTSRWILSFPLILTLGCASAPAPAPTQPPPAESAPPGGTTVEVERMGTPPPASEPPVASAPPVAVGVDPSPVPTGARPGAAPPDRVPMPDPARPASAPAPSTARTTQASARTAKPASTPAKPAPAPAKPPAGSAPVPAAPSGSYSGPDPCKLAVDGDSPVDKACREGGIKAAKTAMKSLLKDARANGARFDCDDCHINEEDYAQLSQGTDEKFAKLLAAARK
jgi:hypothetical protein